LTFFCGLVWFGQVFNECIERGEEVRILLTEYHRSHSVYPETLDQLRSPLPCARISRPTLLTYEKTTNGYTLSFHDRNVVSALVALAGLRSTAKRTALGNSSCRSPSRFETTSMVKKLTPVALPPGRARLATRPSLTGSSPTANTIGIVAVAALAA